MNRVGGVVGELAVEFAVKDLQVERQSVEDCWDDQAAHTVGRVSHHLEGPEDGRVDERARVVGEGIEQVGGLDRASAGPVRQSGFHQFSHPDQPGVPSDGAGTGQAELDAVVVGRVVAGRDHGRRNVEVS